MANAAALLPLTGCQSVLAPFGAIGQTLHYAISPQTNRHGTFAPDYEFLLIDVQGRRAVMALGQRKVTPSAQGDVIDEYWYSGDREMMHLRNGRLHVLLGMTTEWRDNRSTPPTWANLQADASPIHWVRARDEMPHYRYGLQDQITTKIVPTPPVSVPDPVAQLASSRPLRWVLDQVETTDSQGQRWTFTQNFALDQNQVVYSEQCITPSLCLRLQYKR